MEKGGGGDGKPATRFGFSWADEVEREEREQQQQQEQVAMPQRREAKREQSRADPFGAARPREVVLAEKGVDWRARDCELDLDAPRHRVRYANAAAARAFTVEEAPSRASILSVSTCRAIPARPAPWDRDAGSAGRTPHPRRHAADSTAKMAGRKNAPPVTPSAWGGKRKCAGDGPAPRVFSEVNVGKRCSTSVWGSTKKSRNTAGTQAIKASETAAVADGESRGRRVPAATMAATEFHGSAVGHKKRGGKRRGRGSKKTEN